MDRLEDLYYQNTIYRSCVLCADDEEAAHVSKWLDEHNHTVVCITTEDVEDLRLRYVTKLLAFKDYARVVVLSYPAWYAIAEEVEVHVLTQANLIAFGNLPCDTLQYVKRRLGDAVSRGFKSNMPETHIIHLHDDDDN